MKKRGINSPLYWHTVLGYAPAPWPRPEGYVQHVASIYVMTAGDTAVKIGVSIDPGRRVKSLQNGQDKIVRIYWAADFEFSEAYEIERAVHKRLKTTPGHASGEWYYIDPETAVGVIRSECRRANYHVEPNKSYGLFREGAEVPA